MATLIGVCFTVLSAFGRQLTLPRDLTLPNPLGVLPIHNVEEGITGALLTGSFLILVLVAVASLIRRFRASRGVERQQLKWFAYAATVLVMGFILQGLVDATIGRRLVVVDAILLALVPLSIAIAILRYRLYDIDLVINRTLVYGSLTVLLGAVYVGGVVGLSQLLPVEGNDLAVAGSTLAVAALFSPARRRIQAFVDRRFYRRRYDARRTVEEFSTRLRDQVDLETLVGELQGVVRDTLAPASVGVWLRPTEEGLGS